MTISQWIHYKRKNTFPKKAHVRMISLTNPKRFSRNQTSANVHADALPCWRFNGLPLRHTHYSTRLSALTPTQHSGTDFPQMAVFVIGALSREVEVSQVEAFSVITACVRHSLE